jgi:hypothetical protein
MLSSNYAAMNSIMFYNQLHQEHHPRTVRKYQDAMALLTVHHELTEEEIDMFQDLVNDIFEKWLQIFGHEGVSNYIHLYFLAVILITL